MVGMALQSYDDMTLYEVIDYARNVLAAAADEPPTSAEHAQLISRYEGAMAALKHKMYLLNVHLGLQPIIIPDEAVSSLKGFGPVTA
jgi:hypothetical protein